MSHHDHTWLTAIGAKKNYLLREEKKINFEFFVCFWFVAFYFNEVESKTCLITTPEMYKPPAPQMKNEQIEMCLCVCNRGGTPNGIGSYYILYVTISIGVY